MKKEMYYNNIQAYWDIVKKGGIMFGDDYAPEWPGVVNDVCKFFNDYYDQLADFGIKGVCNENLISTPELKLNILMTVFFKLNHSYFH